MVCALVRPFIGLRTIYPKAASSALYRHTSPLDNALTRHLVITKKIQIVKCKRILAIGVREIDRKGQRGQSSFTGDIKFKARIDLVGDILLDILLTKS